jgi:Ser/Thr protein kinase RdoA (MazF antagonist)
VATDPAVLRQMMRHRDGLVDGACQAAGYPPGADLMRQHANAVYLLTGAPVVVRVGYGAAAAERAARSLAVTRWLAGDGFPATVPTDLPSGVDQPLVVATPDGEPVAVTFWRYYPQDVDRPPSDPAALGRIAADLHRRDAPPPVSLPRFRPLEPLSWALDQQAARSVLTKDQHAWLLGRAAELRAAYEELDFPLGYGLVHGDMHRGNLLRTAHGTDPYVLADWDGVCVGPREIDLVPAYQDVRFGADPATVGDFADAYGYQLPDWAGFQTLYDIRELETLSAVVLLASTNAGARTDLIHRLVTLRRGDRAAVWHEV